MTSNAAKKSGSTAAVLASHGVLYGTPATRAHFDAHALITYSYYHSAHGVDGGGDALAAAFVARLKELGGTVRLGDGVAAVEIQGRRVRRIVTDAGLGVGRRMAVTLSCDHRVMDGAMGARFLQDVKRLLEEPLRLLV